MSAFGGFFGTLDPIVALCGLVLLAFGRRLVWLALGAVGFLLGLELARHTGIDASDTARLAFGLVLGLVGAVVAVAAQRLAVALAGIVVGGLGVLWLAQPWAADLGPWVWALALVGAIAGVALAQMVFAAALVIITSLLGAGLLVHGLDPVDPYRLFMLPGFAIVGLVLQSRALSRRRRHRD